MNNEKDKIFVFGASGHAKVIIDIIERAGRYDIAFLLDDNPSLRGANFYGYQVIGGKAELLSEREQITGGIVAIGSNKARLRVAEWLEDNNFSLINAIHPHAQLARGVEVDNGSVIMAGAIINSDTRIGRNVIVNTGSTIDHDCTIFDGVHIAPGATLCGSVVVGKSSFVCAGATIIPNLTIGSGSIVGSGSTVIKNVADNILVVGSPALQIKRLDEF